LTMEELKERWAMNRERVKRKYAQLTMEELEEWQAKDKRKYAQLTTEELEERHA
jgi:hypothetical protein